MPPRTGDGLGTDSSRRPFPTRTHFGVTLAVGGGPGCPIGTADFREGLAVRKPPDGRARRPGRRLVVAADAPAPRVLVRLARPYPARTALAVVTLVAYTLVALLPPYLVQARGRRRDPGTATSARLSVIVAAFLAAGIAAFALSGAQTYFTGWVGERALADLRIQLFGHLQRLSLGYYERNRTGAIVSRITNDVEALDQLVTDGVSSLVQNTPRARGHDRRPVPARLAPRARHARRPSADGPRHRLVPLALESRLPPRAGASRARHGHARRGHLRHARRPVVHARADEPVRRSAA